MTTWVEEMGGLTVAEQRHTAGPQRSGGARHTALRTAFLTSALHVGDHVTTCRIDNRVLASEHHIAPQRKAEEIAELGTFHATPLQIGCPPLTRPVSHTLQPHICAFAWDPSIGDSAHIQQGPFLQFVRATLP
jgi:hypothetical protein